MDFEEEVEKLIEDYGCPENMKEDLKGFLIGSCNAWSIGELYVKYHKED